MADSILAGRIGPKGDTGVQGPQGATGATGPQGPGLIGATVIAGTFSGNSAQTLFTGNASIALIVDSQDIVWNKALPSSLTNITIHTDTGSYTANMRISKTTITISSTSAYSRSYPYIIILG